MADFQSTYKLKTNPFRLTPANEPSELVWAGFKDVKEKFARRVERSVRIPNSTLVLNWGEYGSGKTHAARYFNKKDVLLAIANKAGKSIPYSTIISLPKGKEPVYSIYVAIIDKLNIEKLREDFGQHTQQLITHIESIGSNIHIQNVLKAIFNTEVPHLEIKKYLYGNASVAELRTLNELGILRPVKDDTDYTSILAGLFSCLTFQKEVYSCVIIWIDEFEDIAVLNNSNIDKTNNFIREILDNVPDNLLLFLNLTQSALISAEDLGQYVYDSVRSRIKERISFDLPSPQIFKEYLKELLTLFRNDAEEIDPYFPFNETVITTLIQEQGNVSLRQFNESLSLLLELSDMDEKCPIDMDVFNNYKSEIIWHKD
ncbi:hypothetical protein SAMN05421788_10364 [Filimonas lacunae]|uniref:Uncharacterized protein n=1 Tax=Filimonas lacunae TaxID=477680 RepID=A0A173MJC4_9BACT|nr:hypothetical protein [Filimonas lacunae]BAV07714.1 hypothetical protein FLA_3745 [Filimonas lacunae]SIT03915.1 hypothetical protein SAMN05421788_10364 [Filimonas lacunae]